MGFFGRGRTTRIENRADKISEFTVNTAEYGTVVPEILGTTRVSGNLIYYDDFTAHEHREEDVQRSGKGGGHSKTVTVNITYTYTVACIFGLCEGEITKIGRVWRGKEIYTYPNNNIQLTLFKGTQNQQPWAYVVGKHPNKALPYSGLAYMAGIIDMGTSVSLPQFNFEVYGKSLDSSDGIDVNPASYIRYVLNKVGLSSVAIEGLDKYKSYCYEYDLYISSPPDGSATSARNIVNEIAKLTNACFFWSNDRFKIVPLETRGKGTYSPDTTILYDLTKDDFLPQSNGALVTYSRTDSSEDYNSFPVEFYNRANAYEKETVSYQLSEDIRINGLRQAPVTSAHYIYTKQRAVKIAEMLARKAKLERNVYTFKVGWAFALLEPADIVTLTDENIGINRLPVRITTVTEDAKGVIVCTAVAVDNVSGEAEYDVHEVDRPYVDFNIIPPDTARPLIFQPPADLTNDGLELWIGAKGSGDGWGGCTVYISDDNLNYRMLGQINSSSRIGELTEPMSATATSCVVTCNGTLLSGTQQDAERGNTLCWVGGECFSYTTATLVSANTYRLSGLVRGQYNTPVIAHSDGEQFARLDNTLLKESFRKEDVGKRVYLKFASYNTFGAMEQELSEVQAYEYVLLAYYVPSVRNLTTRNRYRQLKDGVSRYDIVVHWTEPNMQSYLEGRVWYKTSNAQSKYLTMQNVKVSELGFTGDWIFGGSGKNEVVIPQANVGDKYKIAVTTVDVWGVETQPDVAPQTEILVALKTETPNTPDGFGITFGEEVVATWKEVTNSDIAYYEVRYGDVVLVRVTGLKTTLPLTSRTGTLYLYAVSASGKYSSPAVLEYNKPAPPKPFPATLTPMLNGFSALMDDIPTGCNGINLYINSNVSNVKVHIANNSYTHACEANGYWVVYSFTDAFGEGQRSDETSTTVKAYVDAAMLEAEAITKEKLSAALQSSVEAAEQNIIDTAALAERVETAEGTLVAQGASITQNATDISSVAYRVTETEDAITTQGSSITQNADAISAVVTNLNDSTLARNYSAIQIMQDGIATKVSSNELGDEVSSFLSQSATGFYIKGELIHISGDTLFDNGVITADMLQAGAITADAIYQAGYKVKNIRTLTGTVSCSTTVDQWVKVPIPADYTPEQCIVSLTSVVDTRVKNLVFDTCVKSDGYTYVMLLNVYYNAGQSSIGSVSIRYQTVGIK